MATTVFFVSGTSLTIPSNYNSASNTWEAIGGGGGASYGAGAGGAEYRKITNASYTSSATRTCQIGAGGTGSSTNGTAGSNGTLTKLLADNNSTVALQANNGNGASYGATVGGTAGTGGTGAGGNFNGGAGGNSVGGGGSGGGGAAGPNAAGAAGGATGNGGLAAGGGGGGSNGGSTGGATTGGISAQAGGAGGNGRGGTGAGAAGTSAGGAGGAGTAGTGAGGGGGGINSPTTGSGGAGATGNVWTQTSNSATAGPGGGGGGTAGDGTPAHGARVGGNGGLYGGGGGGDGNFSTGTVKGGSGAQGIIVLTYTPAAGGSPYTMPAATGAVALAGQAATLTKTTAGANPVQKNGGTVSANASIATSLPGATTAGNTILIFASGGGTITTPSGFTSRSPAVNALGCYIFEKLVASGNSTDTPTLTMSGAYDAVWQIAEYKNITAYDTSSSQFSASLPPGPYSTPTITPASGNKRIFGFIGSTVITGGFAAGDPQSWANSFIGQQSNLLVGPGGAGRTPIASGWADLLVTASGVSSYSTAANIGTGSTTLQPHSIIAAYTTTDIPPVNPWPTFRSISSVGYASHTNTVVTAPTGILDGDILILTIAVFGTPTPAAVTLPSGFTLIDKSVAGAGGSNVNMSVAWKRASSESGSYTITHATANTNAFIAVYSGCIASGSPVDAYIFNAGLGATTDTTNLVSSVANTTALYIDHDWTAGGGRSAPTPMLERYENLTYLADNPLPTSGTSGRVIATNSNLAGGDPWAAWSVLLKPAVSAGGSPYTMPAAKGSVTLAGTVTGLRAARQLAAVKGSIALAGTTTGLRAARTLTAVKGSIALAGLATGLRVARILTAVKGSIVLTGFAAGLVYSSFKTLTAAVGSITLAGQAATLRLTRVMAAAKGTINLTGFDVVLTKTSAAVNKILTAAAGAFTFVGQDAALRRERRLPAAPGAITLAGQAATLRVARMLAAAKGTITLAGSDTLLLKGKSPLLATTGAILVAGNTANLVYRASYRMAAASASIRLAAREAGLSRSGTEQPGVMEFGRKAYLRRW
jgi:hypothetical protein